MDFTDIFLVFITFLSAWIIENIIWGWGGLLILPVLFNLWIDPLIAVSTLTWAFLWTSSFSLLKLKKEWKFKINLFPLIFIFFWLIWSFIWLNIVIDLDENFLKNIVNFSLILMLFFLFIPIKSNFNFSKKTTLIISIPLFIFLWIYNSIIWSWAGFIWTFLFLFLTKLSFKEVAVYRFINWFLMCLLSTIFHFFHWNLDFQLILIWIIWWSIWGYFWAHFFIKLDEKILKKLFAVIVVIMVILNYI